MKKVIIMLFIAIFTLVGLGCYVYADDTDYSCDITIDGNNSILKKGDTITYDIKVSNINAEDGIILVNAKLDYDDNVFDCKVESVEEWTLHEGIENIVTLSRKDLLPNSDDQVIGKLILTAKSDANDGNYTFGLSKIKCIMEGDKFFQVSDKSKKIEIKNDSSENNDNKDEQQEQGDKDTEKDNNSQQNEKEEGNQNKQANKDNAQDNKDIKNDEGVKKEGITTGKVEKTQIKTNGEEKIANLPHTGVNKWFITISIVLTIIIAIIAYKKYKKWQKV